MSTGYGSKKSEKMKNLNRFAELARLGEAVFHSGDLANIWHITNKNTLHTTIKRYVDRGLLFRIHKGFYSIKDPTLVDPLILGLKALHSYAYVSTETVLRAAGIIQQEIPVITLVSGKSSHFSIVGHQYYSRRLADKFLHQPIGILVQAGGVRIASTERAVADLLYFNKAAYFDLDRSIDWKSVREIQTAIGFPLTPKRYG